MKKVTGLFMIMITLILLSGFKSSSADKVCSAWSDVHKGMHYRYCKSNENLSYYDLLQWENLKSYNVRVGWNWSYNGKEGLEILEMNANSKSDYIPIGKGYKVIDFESKLNEPE